MTHSFRRFYSIFLALCLVLTGLFSTAGCGHRPPDEESTSTVEPSAPPSAEEEQAAFDAYLDRLFREEIVLNTLNLHYLLKDPAAFGIGDYEVTLGDASWESAAGDYDEIRDILNKLNSFQKDLLTEEQRLYLHILTDDLTVKLAGEDYLFYQTNFSPTVGIQTQLPILLAEYLFYDEGDVREYLELLELLPAYYQQLLSLEQEKSTKGLFMSDQAVDDIIKSCRAFLAEEEEHYLLLTFEERLAEVDGLTEEDRLFYRTQNEQIFREKIRPAYEGLIDGLTTLKGTGRYEGGLCHYPDGKDYYEYLIKSGTGTGRTVEELRTLIRNRIDLQMMEISYHLQNSRFDPEDLENFTFSLTDPAEILADLKSKLDADFPAIPETFYRIKHVPKALEDTLSPAFYLVPPLDAPFDNVIYINNSQLNDATLYSTLAHEGYPGHLYQSVYAATLDRPLLLSLLSCPGYSEGWATYVEHYAYGLDDGVESRLARLISLNDSVILGIYALADIGINYDGWTKEETRTFLKNWFGELDDETLNEFFYAMVEEPGNYQNYYVGYLEILLMREEAETVLGRNFDLKAFHTFLLDMSDCTFRVIRPYFDRWLATQ